jgi:hypothetical protein
MGQRREALRGCKRKEAERRKGQRGCKRREAVSRMQEE